MKFTQLVAQISEIDNASRLTAGRVLQQLLSLRNWLVGAHIIEFEQAGEERAAYGQRLIATLARVLGDPGCQGLAASNLKNGRQVALAYPQLDAAGMSRRLTLQAGTSSGPEIRQTSGESTSTPAIGQTSGQIVAGPFPSLTRRAAEQPLPWRDAGWVTRLFTTLSFSHLLELSRIDDVPRPAFYELHCLKESWSVRELQRQRDSMLYECIRNSKDLPDFTRTDEHFVWLTLHGTIQDPAFLRFLEQVGREMQVSCDLEDLLVLDLVHREERVPDWLADRLGGLCHRGIVERVGRGRGTRYLLSRRFYRALGQEAAYTRRRGLDRETNKALLVKHIQGAAPAGAPLAELQQVLPALSRDQLQTLLRELKAAGEIEVRGTTRAACWFPGPKRNRTQ